MSALTAPGALPIPASHLDLLTRPICGVFTTMCADGQPQSSLVWVDVASSSAFTTETFTVMFGYLSWNFSLKALM